MPFIREASLVKYKDETISTSVGSSGAVEFNFEEIWDKWKTTDKDPRQLHFIHVHPPGFDHPSTQDEICVRGFNIAFGYPVLFSIITFNDETNMKTYQFINGKWFESFRLKVFPLDFYWLKNTSTQLENQ